MSKLDELRLDLVELKDLLEKSTRQRIKDLLAIEIRKIETEIITKGGDTSNGTVTTVGSTRPTSVAAVTKPQGGYEVKITNYGWDQSDKFVKIYIDLPNVNDLAKSEFTAKSVNVTFTSKDNKSHTLTITNLANQIIPDESHAKVKTDKVVVFLRKANSTRWSTITSLEKKAKEPKTPKMDEKADPSSGLMDLMKQMYEEGDDEMKRTIAKAWTESRDKSSLGEQV